MAITTAQRNAGYRQLGMALATSYPQHLDKMFRVIAREVKGGTTQQKEIAKVVARELYQSATGIDPVGQHAFKHLVHAAICDADGSGDGLVSGDAFDAENITVT